MKRLLTLFLASALVLTSCSKQEDETEESEHKVEAGHEGEIASEYDDDGAYDYFFECYKKSETPQSVTKEKEIEFILFPDSDDSYNVDSITYIKKVKNGDEYDANIILNDVVDGEKDLWVFVYTDGYLYYESNGGLYKEVFENWNEVRKSFDGYYFELVDYTVNGVHVSDYKDGYKKVEFSFDLDSLSEAPDENIFEILSSTASTWQNLSFNDASFEGYISPEGYVTSYIMYYNGQVAPGDGKDKYPFSYKTTVTFSDINSSTVDLPDNPDDYTEVEVEVPEEEEAEE